jgi:hypothetical protein
MPLGQEGLVGHINRLGRDQAGVEGIQRPVRLIDHEDLVLLDPGGEQVGLDLVLAVRIHGDGAARQVADAADLACALCQQCDRRMLHQGCQDDDGRPVGALDHQRGGANADIGPSFDHLPQRIDARAAFLDGDRQAGIPVVTERLRRVERRKLELVFPDQLDRNGVARERERSEGRQKQAQQAPQYHHHDLLVRSTRRLRSTPT